MQAKRAKLDVPAPTAEVLAGLDVEEALSKLYSTSMVDW